MRSWLNKRGFIVSILHNDEMKSTAEYFILVRLSRVGWERHHRWSDNTKAQPREHDMVVVITILWFNMNDTIRFIILRLVNIIVRAWRWDMLWVTWHCPIVSLSFEDSLNRFKIKRSTVWFTIVDRLAQMEDSYSKKSSCLNFIYTEGQAKRMVLI